MYFGQPNVAGMPQIAVAIALCEGAFHARATGILGVKLGRLLAGAGLLDRRVLLARANADRARTAVRRGTVSLPWTCLTSLAMNPNHHPGVPMRILGRVPGATDLAFGADGLLRLPVKAKLRDGDPMRRVGFHAGSVITGPMTVRLWSV